jgi:hypothetical protein
MTQNPKTPLRFLKNKNSFFKKCNKMKKRNAAFKILAKAKTNQALTPTLN